MVLTRYRDVASALRDPQMRIVGGAVDEAAHREMREQARHLYSAEQIANWRPQFIEIAHGLLSSLRNEIELVRDFAEPCSMDIAALVTGLDPHEARDLAPAAQVIFDAGAARDDAALKITSRDAVTRLSSRFPRLVAALHTQAFVALAVSLPAFLGNALLALLENRDQLHFLAERLAIDELLRFGGPSLMQFRVRADGERVELRLAEANRDPDQFEHPDQLDLRRRDASTHLAFGGGSHACVGGPLVKAAATAVISEIAERLPQLRLIGSEPYGGAAIRGHWVYVI
jgi:cytochrome P450